MDDDDINRRREPEGWHLDKRIPIATLVAIFVLAIGGITHIMQIRTDLEILRQQQAALSQRVERSELANREYLQKIDRSLERLNDKFDRAISDGAVRGRP